MHKTLLRMTKAKKKHFSNGYKAFSMSEVLIVLGLVAVISTMLIGGFNHWKNAQYPTMRAVFKNDFAQAMSTMNTEQNLASVRDTNDFVDKFNKYLDTSNKCTENCLGSSYKDAGGNAVNIPNYDYTFKIPNGTTVSLSYKNSGVQLSQFLPDVNAVDIASNSYEASNAALNYVIGVFDVNGPKGPNVIGEDMGIIIPGVFLDKSKGEYLTFDPSGQVIIKSKSPDGKKTSSDRDGKVVVDKDGNFIPPNDNNSSNNKCEGNYIYDDYGTCNICSLTTAKCEAQGKTLNKQSCECEFNKGCPKGKVLNSKGECVCKISQPAPGPYAQYEANANGKYVEIGNGAYGLADANTPKTAQRYSPIWDSESCSYKVQLGAALKCSVNGGTWNAVDGTCGCGSKDKEGSAEFRCISDNGDYAEADPNNYCKCKCKSSDKINALIQAKENPSKKAGFVYSAVASDKLSERCYICNSGKTVAKSQQLNKNDETGLCTLGCSKEMIAIFDKMGKDNPFHTPPANYSNTNNGGQCTPTCKLTDAYCNSAAFKLSTAGAKCTLLSNTAYDKKTDANLGKFKGCPGSARGKTYKTSGCLGKYSFNGSQEASGADNFSCASAGIKFKANMETCRCELSYPDKVKALFANVKDGEVAKLDYWFHGECGHLEQWHCTYQRIGSVSDTKNPNAKNLLDSSKPTGYTGIKEECKTSYDPILLVLSENYATPKMKSGTVSVKMTADKDEQNVNITWLSGQSEPSYYFLIKDKDIKSIDNFVGKLFTDVGEYATGLEELKELFDTNKDGVVNALDKDFNKLGVWADKNANGQIDESDVKKSLSDLNIIEISTAQTFVSSSTGAAEQSDKAITSIHGSFTGGVAITSDEMQKGIWLKRDLSKHNQVEYVIKTPEQKTVTVKVPKEYKGINPETEEEYTYTVDEETEETITEDVEYRYKYVDGKYLLLDSDGNIDSVEKMHPLFNKHDIKRYFEKNGKIYREQEYTLIDILFRSEV